MGILLRCDPRIRLRRLLIDRSESGFQRPLHHSSTCHHPTYNPSPFPLILPSPDILPLPPSPPPRYLSPMTGDILKKRKIAVLGSRSVGACARPPVSATPRPLHRPLDVSVLTVLLSGKSSLVIKFIDNNFVDSYYPTIESTFSKSINHKGTEYECDIIDTAGQVSCRFPTTSPFPLPFLLTRAPC